MAILSHLYLFLYVWKFSMVFALLYLIYVLEKFTLVRVWACIDMAET